MQSKANLKGMWKIEHLDSEGNVKGVYEFHNDIVNQGKNDLLDIMFSDGTQVASTGWYVGLISSSGYSALAAADTMASHAGWTEFTGYSETTRQAWGPGAAASQSITNSTPITFSITSNGTIKGLFVCTNDTKGGTTGRLWATGLWSTGDANVVNGDSFRATYTVSL
jgi:hypothetical protein